jgi:hypothetical protein
MGGSGGIEPNPAIANKHEHDIKAATAPYEKKRPQHKLAGVSLCSLTVLTH